MESQFSRKEKSVLEVRHPFSFLSFCLSKSFKQKWYSFRILRLADGLMLLEVKPNQPKFFLPLRNNVDFLKRKNVFIYKTTFQNALSATELYT